jgi:hypothetical protein
MKICIIRQPAGLGDILFTYKIAKKIIETKKADIIYWPVDTQYSYLNNYLRDTNIIFVDETNDFPFKDVYLKDAFNIINTPELLYIPLQRADNIMPYNDITVNHPMYCKYELVGLDFNDWCSYVNICRDFVREEKLEKFINIDISNFNLVNKVFGTPPFTQISKPIPDIKDSIEITQLGFDNPFDWCGLLDQAEQVHTVDTSFCYILAFLNKTNVTVYSRNTVTNFKYIKKVFPVNWQYISL